MKLPAIRIKTNSGPAKLILDIASDFLGALLFGIGICVFTAPNRIAPGGVTGIATIINHLSGFPIGTANLLINLPLFLLALKVWGRVRTLYTLKSVVIMSLVIDLLSANIPVYTGNPLLAALFGGVCMGCGLAAIFARGSTTGGTDILGRYLQSLLPHVSIGRILLGIDAVILCVSAIVYNNIETFLYGLIVTYVTSRLMDSLLYGLDNGKMALIISKKRTEISGAIMENMERGVTFLRAKGAYSGEEKDVLLCAVRRQQFPTLKKLVFTLDPDAFFIAVSADEIFGDGFNRFT